MIETLLIFYCGKDSRKRKKVLEILKDIRYNEIINQFGETKLEFVCKSLSEPAKRHIVIYSTKKMTYICDCKEILYRPYRVFENPKEKNRKLQQRGCSHIIASKIYLATMKKS